MTRYGTLAAGLAAMMALAACGGGGGGGGTGGDPANGGNGGGGGQPAVRPDRTAASETHRGGRLVNRNFDPRTGWYANPRVDLPRHGRDGLDVEMPPRGGAAALDIDFDPSLADRLEPGWRGGGAAADRLASAERALWTAANAAYLQWTRHLDYNPGPPAIQIGEVGDLDCGPNPNAIACHVEWTDGDSAVILSAAWIEDVYDALASGDDRFGEIAVQNLFAVITHEAGHQFGYENPRGSVEGCGDHDHPCHAPVGSGSVMSYDHLPPSLGGVNGSVRYNVTAEDVRHIPDATWNPDGRDLYAVSMSGVPSSIDRWGVWIEHYFEVSGRTDPGRLWGGGLSVTDEIHGRGWVRGRPSGNALPPAAATWSGEDNFLGVDLHEDFLGALLRADANLRYTFGQRPDMTLRVSGFEAHYDAGGGARWHDHDSRSAGFGDFTYRMDCTRDGCSGDVAQARWYASDAGDPSGWVGGVVEDPDNSYVGSFVAEKD
ncbi:MAG: hypothetical protein OXD36_14980 [Rhodobacter sp.]|nr:hypothetical protein [Rhodobacter sp.]